MEDKKVEKQEAAKETKQESNMVQVFGKTFDVSTEEGRKHLEAWGAGFSAAHGRQANKLGSLRKLEKLVQVTEDDQKLEQQIAELRADDKHAEADRLLMTWTQKERGKSSIEMENQRFWLEASKRFNNELQALNWDVDDLQTLAERRLGDRLYDAEDQMEILEEFILAKSPKVTASSPASRVQVGGQVPTDSKEAVKETPKDPVDVIGAVKDVFKS